MAQTSSSGEAGYAPGVDPHLTLGHLGQDETFVTDGMNNVSAEIEWSRIAYARTTNPEVKALADETVREDMPVAARLAAEAKVAGYKIPDGVTGKHKKESEKLGGLSGDALDKEYVTALMKVQHEDVGSMREEVKYTKRPSFADFAEKNAAQVTARNDKAKVLDKKLRAK